MIEQRWAFPDDADLVITREMVLSQVKYDWLIMGDHVETVMRGLRVTPVSDETRERWIRLGAAIDVLDALLDEVPVDYRDEAVTRCRALLDGDLPRDTGETLVFGALKLLRASYAPLGEAAWERLATTVRRIAVVGRWKATVTHASNYRDLLRLESDLTVDLFLTAMTVDERTGDVGRRLFQAFRRLTRGAVFFDHARDLDDDLAEERAAMAHARWARVTLYAASTVEFLVILRWPKVFHALMSPWPDKLRSLWHLVTTRNIVYGDDAWERWTADPEGGRPVTDTVR